MKELIKTLTLYNYLYPVISKTGLYKALKRLYGQGATMLNGDPSQGFFVIGVTGTDGKTTTCNLIHHILNTQVGKTLLVSTANIKIGDQETFNDKKMTSLDINDLLGIMSSAKAAGCKMAVLEVSSHGLDQLRFEWIQFDMAVLTNITPEHLDYHGTFEKYANTKKVLFQYVLWNTKKNKMAVLPKDDENGRRRSETMTFDSMMTFGIHNTAMMRGAQVQQYDDHTTFTIEYLGQTYPAQTSLVGEFNVYNVLTALSAASLIGLPIQQGISAIAWFTQVDGRMNVLEHDGVKYVIDYAHTPHALESVLSYLFTIKGTGNLIHIFWATGNRDKYKRPDMGNISEQYADVMIVTDDDPDIENRLDIIAQVLSEVKRSEGDRLYVIPEREFAIQLSTQIAQPGDIVVMTWLGHQQIQITNRGKRERNDEQVLKKILQATS